MAKKGLKELFDITIRESLINTGEYTDKCFGYSSDNVTGNYLEYFTRFELDKFVCSMGRFRENYENCSGSELKEKKYKETWIPPKMASVASSSRFCYLALSCIENIEFEYKCKIPNIKGKSPNLDAYDKNTNTYYECKCHEIFDSHDKTISLQYENALFSNNTDSFGFTKLDEKIDKKGKKSFLINDIPFKLFDVKQLLCHLLGIASEQKRTKYIKDATLMYLFFKPDCEKFDKVFVDLKNEITTVFNNENIKQFCKCHKIKLMAEWQEFSVMKPLNEAKATVIYPQC